MEVTKVAETRLPTPFGIFKLFGFESQDKSEEVLALIMGEPAADDATLVRIHSQCLTGDVFGSERCDCGEQLHFALDAIGQRGSGIVIYQLQDSGQDTVEANHHLGFEADHRNYDLCAAVLGHFRISRVRLMTNNPQKFDAVASAGIQVVERIPVEIAPSDSTKKYLKTKKAKLGHLLSQV